MPLRLGDLLHLDEERTQNRLHMILDSKNMELAEMCIRDRRLVERE